MAELRPYPLAALARRMFRELDREGSIFGLPENRFFGGDADCDYRVDLHGRRIASPLGPAAGPHTQMAQNLVLSWLAGGRCLELKTVQIRDDLTIPRPCIDMRTIGLNAEWSQELRLAESLEEYVKGSMLIDMLLAAGRPRVADDFRATLWDLSVGYDLEGIASPQVRRFVERMKDASEVVERLRDEIPEELGPLRDVDFTTRISDTLTLSTFHGCPPGEIERIADFVLRELGLHCVVKFNPMLLGPQEARHLLHDVLGYRQLRIPDSAFETDTRWEQAVGMMERLSEVARSVGRSLGAKFTNTLIVENDGAFLPPSESEVYLSGAPLHVLAMSLVRRFRRRFGDRFPISFSAGIDRSNFADALALGLAPVTVCTDLLKKGGYGRLLPYYQTAASRWKAVGASDLELFQLRAYGLAEDALQGQAWAADPERRREALEALETGRLRESSVARGDLRSWVAAVRDLNAEQYCQGLLSDPRYRAERHAKPPRKIGRHLQLFDCLTCDLCIPVCPNHANFALHMDVESIPIVKARREGDSWNWVIEGVLPLAERHQIATFADFCNACGNCDVFCPEDGGPYVVKPHFFLHEEDWRGAAGEDGFCLAAREGRHLVWGRFQGRERLLVVEGSRMRFSGEGFELSFLRDSKNPRLEGYGPTEVDLTEGLIMDALRRAVLEGEAVNYLNMVVT